MVTVAMLETSGTILMQVVKLQSMLVLHLDGKTHQVPFIYFLPLYTPNRYDAISEIIFKYIEKTGMSMLETDGPYGGSTCYSKNHSHHLGEEDSVYWQNQLQTELYIKLKEKNVFINIPDYYFYAGGNKVGMG